VLLPQAWARTDEAQRAAAEQMIAAHLAYGQGFDAGRQGGGAGVMEALVDGGSAGEHTARAFQLLQALHPAGPNAVHPVSLPTICAPSPRATSASRNILWKTVLSHMAHAMWLGAHLPSIWSDLMRHSHWLGQFGRNAS